MEADPFLMWSDPVAASSAGYPFQAFEALEPGTHGLDGLAITDLLGSMPLQLEPPGRPGSAPPILHPDGFSPFLETAATFEAARKAAYREQLELPSRPRSAPLEEEIVNVLREEALSRMDPRDKDLFAFQAAAVAPPRSPSPFMGEGPGDLLERQRQALFGLAPARTLQARAMEPAMEPFEPFLCHVQAAAALEAAARQNVD
ncbi:unnamed protein product [Symbiodinium sp. CCMP2456]|nr:unnamed protein product [Symbiodinium sp. CCMP2456]